MYLMAVIGLLCLILLAFLASETVFHPQPKTRRLLQLQHRRLSRLTRLMHPLLRHRIHRRTFHRNLQLFRQQALQRNHQPAHLLFRHHQHRLIHPHNLQRTLPHYLLVEARRFHQRKHQRTLLLFLHHQLHRTLPHKHRHDFPLRMLTTFTMSRYLSTMSCAI